MPDPNIIGGSGSTTLDELLAEQGAAPASLEEMAAICAAWPEDHDPHKMVAMILANRRWYYRPPVHGGRRTICTAAIVLACILLAALAIMIVLLSPSDLASASNRVGAGFFFPTG